ncbi:elongation of very long chain fatty acids protein AAEL008004 isoform X1 [Eupeodes corollae]|uniref:elongation of very long chain fatty acids protein AAEL008004 isoform X1 n=1 Tax=Eupeodes corollae TaxID=290404 RepID=UPI0024907FFB|nr:elongation of very long chain fatty acids protein AAEL008004 isoform X1 [Eupeodes corollae]XP_055903893.1 elongation of very long chain fatty acids protein AAEL008004 isoform X1 [Eupeodes corollae]XP_055903894.1 elongation of very long chain fatty acids protein AAEL008004 isoform X1 [Eupeodes corollae]XP_055903895.1 elongation of very long chain fatty acids protein AAEL008004 isoform X1 [Eupeodes corollae]
MALIMKYIDSMQRYMDSYGDSRTKDWPMMSSPFPTLAACLTYVYLVKVLGPRLMENRKPFHLQYTLIVYNLSQVIFSAWLFYEIASSGWLTGHYNFRCQPVDYSNNPRTLRMVNACWWYYFSKFTEFLDTMFFVLRKKTSQVTTLHVIHHGCMPMSVWFGVKFTPGGHSTFFGLLNTFVHIVMYTYYLFAAMGPQYQKYLWWKRYLTTLQMIQFVAIMVHAFQLLFIECNYPKAFVWWIGMHAVMFFFLFNEFYKSTYKGNNRKYKNLLMFVLQRRDKSYVAETPSTNGHCNGDAITSEKATSNGHCNGSTQSNGVKSAMNGSLNGSLSNGVHKNGSAITANGGHHHSLHNNDSPTPTGLVQRKIQK